MKCVHGVEMAERCESCPNDHNYHHVAFEPNCLLVSDGIGARSVPNVQIQADAQDRLATELASLAQSIQGLSWNVAKLVEERAPAPVTAEDSRWSDEEVSSMSRNPVQPYEFNRIPEIPKDWFKTVKRGPVTDDEVDAFDMAWNGSLRMSNHGRELAKIVLEGFASSRGLID